MATHDRNRISEGDTSPEELGSTPRVLEAAAGALGIMKSVRHHPILGAGLALILEGVSLVNGSQPAETEIEQAFAQLEDGGEEEGVDGANDAQNYIEDPTNQVSITNTEFLAYKLTPSPFLEPVFDPIKASFNEENVTDETEV